MEAGIGTRASSGPVKSRQAITTRSPWTGLGRAGEALGVGAERLRGGTRAQIVFQVIIEPVEAAGQADCLEGRHQQRPPIAGSGDLVTQLVRFLRWHEAVMHMLAANGALSAAAARTAHRRVPNGCLNR
ncbi:hypothetical protein [Streptomyces sp. NBC_01358]|uniref:hypothetical protein n=1 Tax=Streptomyces sp. NBC_01358 TaxID=2903837 RepID=UPI002E35F699|nr:hypothetical protein [Streptomyces sp. NBC_01358]